MNKSGRTPLFRAKKLESLLGVQEIYLKLEGSNPFGHKFDRIGEILVKDARAQDKGVILADGPRLYIQTVQSFAELEGIKIYIPVFKGQNWKSQTFSSDLLIDLRKTKSEDQSLIIEQLCHENNYYNGANGYYNTHLSILALEEIGEELIEKIQNISSVYTQLSFGYTVSSLYNSFFRGWVKGKLDKYPQIYSCTIPKGNKIYEDYKERNSIADIDGYNLKLNKYTKDLYIENTQLLEESLKAIRDTDGEIITIDEDLLKEAAVFLRTHEYINVSTEQSYSFAGFYKRAKEGKISTGKHVIILNNGCSDITIDKITDYSQLSYSEIVHLVDTFLAQYTDPIHEIEDAVTNAREKGVILLAKMNGEIQGITIVVHTGFEDFIPTYHLAYIGTRPGRKGRGIASELIDGVIQFTEGNVSLHVDLDNVRARKLYEKFGFKGKYFRMLYQKSV